MQRNSCVKSISNWHTSARVDRRRGAALLLVVIAIVISAMVAATLAQAALAQRRQMQREQLRSQAFWLVESGLDRAAAALVHNGNYTGERWEVAVPSASQPLPGRVDIRVSTVGSNTAQRQIDVTAEFPVGEVFHTTVHRRETIRLNRSPSVPSFPEGRNL